MTMRAYTEGCRAMAIVAAAAFDAAHQHPDADARAREPGLLRIHGAAGQGLQHRDEPSRSRAWACRCTAAWASSRRPARRSTCATPRILTIYEGTTAIQANDLVGRKTARDGGRTAKAIAAQIEATEAELGAARQRRRAGRSRKRLTAAREAFDRRGRLRRRRRPRPSPNAVFAGSRAVPDARRQRGGRLADGARAAGRRATARDGEATTRPS